MADGLNDDARRVLARAVDEARLLGHSQAGAEHILWALTTDPPDSVANAILVRLGISPRILGTELRANLAGEKSLALSPNSVDTGIKAAIDCAAIESGRLGGSKIGPEHLLLGIVSGATGVASQALLERGATLARVRYQVGRVLNTPRSIEGEAVLVVVHQAPGLRPQRLSVLAHLFTGDFDDTRVHVVDALDATRTVFPLGLGMDVSQLDLPPATMEGVDQSRALGNIFLSLAHQLEADQSAPKAYVIVHISEQPQAEVPAQLELESIGVPVIYLLVGGLGGQPSSKAITNWYFGDLTVADLADEPLEIASSFIRSVLREGEWFLWTGGFRTQSPSNLLEWRRNESSSIR